MPWSLLQKAATGLCPEFPSKAILTPVPPEMIWHLLPAQTMLSAILPFSFASLLSEVFE